MTGRQKTVLWIFGLTFGLMIFSVIPWGDFSSSLEAITLGWYFPELAALFLVGAVLVGLVGGLGEEGTVTGIISGAGDFIGAALIIAVARGVTVIMNNSGITDTVLHALEGAVSGLSSGAFAVVMYLVNIPLAFLVPSSSGHATLAMPIMAPLGDFAGVSRAMVVTAYQSASGWMNLFTPTSAIVMGGLALSRVRYDRYLRFVAPLLGILLGPDLPVHAPRSSRPRSRRPGEIDEHHPLRASPGPAGNPLWRPGRILLAVAGLAAALLASACDSAQQVPWATYNSQLQPQIDAATATRGCAALQVLLTGAKATSTAHEKATGFPNDALVAYIQTSQHEAGCPSASG